jgi:hypothetical protein
MSVRIHPRLFLLAIVLIAVIQFISNVIVINNENETGEYKSRLRRLRQKKGEYKSNVQLMVVPHPSSYANKDNNDATTATSGTDDNIRPVICNELLKDPTIRDPSKLPYCMLIFFLVLRLFLCTSNAIFLSLQLR